MWSVEHDSFCVYCMVVVDKARSQNRQEWRWSVFISHYRQNVDINLLNNSSKFRGNIVRQSKSGQKPGTDALYMLKHENPVSDISNVPVSIQRMIPNALLRALAMQRLSIVPSKHRLFLSKYSLPSIPLILPQPPQHQPNKPKKHHDARPKDPLILPGPPLHHANRIPGNAQRVRDRVQPLLRALQNVALLAQVAQHGAAALEELVQLRRRLRHEGLLAQRVRLAGGVGGGGAEGGGGGGGVGVGARRGLVVRIPVLEERVRGRGLGVGVGVFWGGGLVGAAAEEFAAVGDGLLEGGQ